MKKKKKNLFQSKPSHAKVFRMKRYRNGKPKDDHEKALFDRWKHFEEGRKPISKNEEQLFVLWREFLLKGGVTQNPFATDQFARWKKEFKQMKQNAKLDHEIEMRVPPNLPNLKWGKR